jgi:adenylate cyclase class IV
MTPPKSIVKKNIEIRFLLEPVRAKKLLALWRKENWKMQPYSFTDYYFKGTRSSAKIRKWRTPHTPKTEIIFYKRRFGVKTERSKAVSNLRRAMKELEALGFKPHMKIAKEKAWLVSKKGEPTYALEHVPGLGWTGEIEVATANRTSIPRLKENLRRMGAARITRKSILELMEEKLKVGLS